MLNIIISSFLLLGSVTLFVQSFAISGATKWDMLGARFFPQMLLVFAIILTAIILFDSIKQAYKEKREGESHKTELSREHKDTLTLFGSMFVFLCSLKYLGFSVSAVLFLLFTQFYLLKWRCRKGPIFVTAIAVPAIYFLFSKFLNVLFP